MTSDDPPFRLIALLAIAFLAIGCGNEAAGPAVSRTPVSLRGWLVDPPAGPQQLIPLTDTAGGEATRRARAFEQINLSVEELPIASGGIGGNGAFIILDAPPGNVTINFQSPDAPDAQLFLKGVPPSADVFLPALQIQGSEVVPSDPSQIVVRVPAEVKARRPLASNTTVAGHKVQVFEVPITDLFDRLDYPTPTQPPASQ